MKGRGWVRRGEAGEMERGTVGERDGRERRGWAKGVKVRGGDGRGEPKGEGRSKGERERSG